MFHFQPKFFSIQLTRDSLRLVALRNGRVRHFAQFATSTPFFKNDALQKTAFRDFLKEKLSATPGLHGNNVAVSLPEDKTFSKVLSLTKKIATEQDALTEIEQYIPLRIQDVYVDWQILPSRDNETRIAFAASEKKFVDDFLTVFRELDLYVLFLEPESHSLVRALLPKNMTGQAVCLLEIDKEYSTSVIQEAGVIYFSRRIQNKSWQSLYRSVRESCDFFTSHLSPTQSLVERILLCGSRTLTDADSLEQIAKSLKYPVSLADAGNKVKLPVALKEDTDAYAFSVAIGLALRT